VDDRVLAEYQKVARRPELPIEPAQAETLLDVMASGAESVIATPLSVVLPHPDDLPFLEVAREVDALLVTGNRRHFPRKARCGVVVLSPREFLGLLEDTSP
jgi:predicted nucleic acid-binding protein